MSIRYLLYENLSQVHLGDYCAENPEERFS